MVTEKVLLSGFTEFLEGGIEEEAKGRYRLAVTAYFKAMTQICDLLLLRKRGYAPSNHSDRFRMLEELLPDIYPSVNIVFKTYQDTYSIPVTAESCRILKNEIKRIIKLGNIEKDIPGIDKKV